MTSRQKPLPYVIFHSPCLDGFAAAYCAWRHFGDKARYVPLAHTDAIPEFRDGADIYLLDICLPRPLLLNLAKQHDIVILDHHVSSKDALAGIMDEAPRITSLFDMDRSGARLAWHYFNGGPAPDLILNIEDRDLWKNERPTSRATHLALESIEQDFEVWHGYITETLSYKRLITEGQALERHQEMLVGHLLKEVRAAVFEVNNSALVVPTINAPFFMASDVGHALLEKYPDAPFAAVYRDTGAGRRDWSLRSADNRFDVSKVAALHGGGGHRNAAGFSEPRVGARIAFVIQSYDKREKD